MNDQEIKPEEELSPEKSEEEIVKEEKGISFFVEMVKIVLTAILIIVPVRTFVFQPFFVQGASMEPNFHDGEYLIVNELGYKRTVIAAGDKTLLDVERYHDFERGEAVVFRYPNNPSQFYIKRIIGLPGEKVVIKEGEVKIFNEENPGGYILNESAYLANNVETGGDHEMRLKENEFFVMGDNRSHSSDSRSWGVLSGDLIMGRVMLRAWPLSEFEIF